MARTQTTPQGLSSAKVVSVPENWSAQWFRGFITNYLSSADIRNTASGAGISITPATGGNIAAPGTVSLSAEAVGEPYVLAATPTDALLGSYRVLAGQSGVISVTDGGAKGNLSVAVVANGIGAAQFRKSAAVSIVGNPTNAAANVSDIAATADGQVLQRVSGSLSFAALSAASLAPIANNTVLGNVSGGSAAPTALTATQLTSVVNTFTSSLSGAVPASGGIATTYLNGAGAFTTPPSSSGANPSATIGLTVVNGSAATYLTSDSAPALSQAIVPTWTGKHTFSGSAGTVMNAPASGTATLSLSGSANTSGGLVFSSGNSATTSAYDVQVNRAGSTANALAEGPNLVLTDTTNSGYSLLQNSGGQTELWQYNAGWTQVLKILTTHGAQFSGPVGVNGKTPPAQTTGWGTPSGGAVISNFPGASATVAQCATVLAELIGVFKSVGFLGA